MSDLHKISLKALAGKIANKELSSVEVTKYFLARTKQNANLNAFMNVAEDLALSQAEAADQAIASGKKGKLLGVPIAVKDNFLTKGLKTTCCSKFLDNFIPPYNATVVEKVNSQGAVLIGKTAMDEFAMGSSNENSAYGPVLNPWDNTRVPGGTSGGSAAAMAARCVPVALGSDTGGSIRQPAAFCGVSGIKPTYGRVSRYGIIAYASSLDQVGAFAASVEDLALITEVISGHDPKDATSVDLAVPDLQASISQPIKGLRVGVPKEYFIPGTDADIDASVRAAIKQLADLGAEIVEISLPHTEMAVPTYYIVAPAEASSNLSRYDGVRFGVRCKDPEDLMDLYCRSRAEGFGSEVKRRILIGTYVLSSGYYDAYYLRAQKVRTLIANDFKQAFAKDCDVIVCPTTPTTAFKINSKTDDPVSMYLSDVFTVTVNLAGLPAMSIPCGFDRQNLPIGLQLIAKPWDEQTLFKAASAYQQATDWHTKIPE